MIANEVHHERHNEDALNWRFSHFPYNPDLTRDMCFRNFAEKGNEFRIFIARHLVLRLIEKAHCEPHRLLSVIEDLTELLIIIGHLILRGVTAFSKV